MPEKSYLAIPVEQRPPLIHSDIKVFSGNSTTINIKGVVHLSIELQHVKYKCVFHVSSDEVRGILGADFLERYDARVHFARRRVMLNNVAVNVYSSKGVQLNQKVVIEKSYDIPAGRRVRIQCRISGKKKTREDEPVMIEGVKSLYVQSGILAAKVIDIPDEDNRVYMEFHNTTRNSQRLHGMQTVGVIHCVIGVEDWEEPKDTDIEIMHVATSETSVSGNESHYRGPTRLDIPYGYPEKTQITVPPVYEKQADEAMPFFPPEEICTWTCEKVCDVYDTPPAELLTSQLLPEHMKEVFDKHVVDMPNNWDKLSFNKLLDEYHDVFAKDKYDIGRTHLIEHHIETGDEPPVRQKPRRLCHSHHEEVQAQVLKQAKAGIIKPSEGNYASNVILVKKKDNTWRMCVDYRELNSKTKNKDPYMLPRIDDTLDALGGAKYFCTLDLLQGYHQVGLTESSKVKTAFLTPHMSPSLWEYTCMPFGITGGPATFQRLMDKLLAGMEYKIALAYLDDIIVFGNSRSQVMNRLARVFNRLRRAQLKLKPSKCEFFAKETNYLGHLVSSEGVKCDPKKIEAVREWKRPKTNKQAHSFVAFVNYYSRFIKNFAEIAKPLYELSRKRVKFEWTDVHEQAFETLRTAVTSAPVMAYPQKEGDWILDTDASAFAIGGVLSQMQPDENGELQEKVIAYGSKSLQGRQQRYCTRQRISVTMFYTLTNLNGIIQFF